MSERTLAVIRAAAVANNQVGHIRRHIETAGLKIVAQQKVKPVGAEAEAFVASIGATGGSALVLEKDNAVVIWQNLIPVIQRKDVEHLPADSLYGSAQDAVADEIGHLFPKLRPAPRIVSQEPQFANSELVTFGDPEERTLQQIHTCMGVGNVAGGVLCGDAHVGYAQPVGGVVAYDDMVSISGVGFDIACFSGDTRVYTLDGKHPTLAEAVGRELFVMACKPDGQLTPARAYGVKTRENAPLVRIALDNGVVLRPTPDHEFMLRDGSYKSAASLSPGDRLMPFYTALDKDGYVMVKAHMRRRDHLKRLQTMVFEAGLIGPAPILLSENDGVEVHHADQDKSNNDPSNLEAWSGIAHARLHMGMRDLSYMRTDEYEANRGLTIAERLVLGAENHRVVSVEFIDEHEDVYCLRVPEYGNFALLGGVFVHNCGNYAVKTNIPFGAVKNRIMPILVDITRHIAVGLGQVQKRKSKFEHAMFDDGDVWRHADVEHLRQLAVSQVFSIGSSNHYIDLMYEVPDGEADIDQAPVWIGVHFGSRGLGFKSTTQYLNRAGGKEGMFIPPTVLKASSELGQRYIAAMQLAGRYAYTNREAVVKEIRGLLGAREVEAVHNHHNFAWLEEHGGRKLWVVRKGATPAFPGQRGFIGGSMGDDAVIVEGIDSEKSRASFYSTVHGAGRVMSRNQAKQTFTRHQMEEWLRERGVTLIGGDVDESPMSYRRLDDVLQHHEGTIKIVHRLHPFGVIMASSQDRKRDPYHE